jgi:hypothetical protein
MDRKKVIEKLRKNRFTLKEIGSKLNISRQRVHQILNGIHKKKDPKYHKILTKERRRLLGLPSGDVDKNLGGREFTRELVRMRDNRTCQRCGKKWVKGKRRFDVHHLDEKIVGKINTLKVPIKYDRENMDKLITFCHQCHFDWHGEYNKSSPLHQ